MGKEFKRLKRYNATWRLFRTLSAAIAVTLCLIGALLVLSKLQVMETGAAHFAVCAAVGVALGVTYWLMQRRNDLRLAEKIDAEHHLRERVQTMVEYRDQDTAMLQVQREDTEARLKGVLHYGQHPLALGAHFVALYIAMVVLMVGVILPVQAIPEPTKPTEPPFEASEWQKAALEELIAHVEQSDMQDTAKAPVAAELWELRDALDTKLTSKNVQMLVIEVIRFTYQATDTVNSNDEIHDVIERKVLHDQADELAYALGAISNKDREGDVAAIGEVLAKEEMLPTLKGLAMMLEEALAAVVNFDENDPLYASVAAFAKELHSAADAEAAEKPEEARKLLGVAVNNLKNASNLALTQQDMTKEECVYVVDTLCDIFAISASQRPADPDEGYSQTTNKDQSSSSGGLGSEDMQYAGNDQIYDYESDEYKIYGELLTDRYFPLMRNKLKDGSLSEEMLEFIKNYFNELQTGANVGDEDEN